jgi:hypothetical protein
MSECVIDFKSGFAKIPPKRIDDFLLIIDDCFSQGLELADAERWISGLSRRKEFLLLVG